MISNKKMYIELLYWHFSAISLYFYRTNNAMPFDFESRNRPLVKGVKNKWSCSQVWLGYVRLSNSFIVSHKRIVWSRFRVHAVLTCPPYWAFQTGTRVTPKSFSSTYDSLLYAPRRPPSRVQCALKSSKRAWDRYGDVRPRSLAAWQWMMHCQGRIGPLDPTGEEHFYVSACRP